MSPGLGVFLVGVDHRRAPLAVLERLHGRPEEPSTGEPGTGSVRLATCHRVELYTEGLGPFASMERFRTWRGLGANELASLRPHLSIREDAAAARHLLRVSAGLESVVLGEDQVLGQLRDAYRAACAAREPGALLHRLFHAAFRAGKRTRSETALRAGGRSLADSAVSFLDERLGGLGGKSVLVLGSGEMGRIAALALRGRGVGRLLLANRTFSHAESLGVRAGGEALPWAWRDRALQEADGVICACRAPEPVLTEAALGAARISGPGGELVVVDLAVPRSVERPEPIPAGLLLADVEDLGRHLPQRAEALRVAERDAGRIVEEELEVWRSWAEERLAGRDRSRVTQNRFRSCNMAPEGGALVRQ